MGISIAAVFIADANDSSVESSPKHSSSAAQGSIWHGQSYSQQHSLFLVSFSSSHVMIVQSVPLMPDGKEMKNRGKSPRNFTFERWQA